MFRLVTDIDDSSAQHSTPRSILPRGNREHAPRRAWCTAHPKTLINEYTFRGTLCLSLAECHFQRALARDNASQISPPYYHLSRYIVRRTPGIPRPDLSLSLNRKHVQP